MELIKKENHFQIQSKAMKINKDDKGVIKSIVLEGYASTKDKDRVNDIVLPTAFESALGKYMENPRVFLQHDSSKNIGNTIEAKINSKGLYVKTEILLNISLDGTDGVRLFDAIEKGLYKTYSIGYRVKDIEEIEVRKDGIITGYERVIKDLDLMEISLVSVPANPYALIKSIEDCLPETKSVEEVANSVNLDGEANVVKEASDCEECGETEGEKDEVVETTEEPKEDAENVEIKEESVEKTVEEVIEEKTTEEVKEDAEDIKEEPIVEDTENSVETTEDEGEKSQIVEDTKDISNSESHFERKVKEFETNFVKNFDEKIEKLSDCQTKEVSELRSDIKEVSDGFVGLVDQFKEVIEYVKDLEKQMSKVVIKKGYTYEKTQSKPLDPFSKAIKIAKGI